MVAEITAENLELKMACFPAIPQLILDTAALKLVPFVDVTDARKDSVRAKDGDKATPSPIPKRPKGVGTSVW